MRKDHAFEGVTCLVDPRTIKMIDSKTIKENSDKLLCIASQIKLLGRDFADFRIAKKILVIMLERYETFIAPLENTKICLRSTKMLHAL